ncbi:DDE-type integrase/transposase/recombinase [Alcaligenes aquatilis]|uniref:Mu transposase C-terminal domain-containing protein n=1 Tax=Alcaligenes aquatilis TaxID=323284 RepID=UPI001C5810F0|nr:Mu transposase C-terminal domain-containing protein [Alcaligenes aquatilis]QXR35345.1 DDE-type integrase/transposase/recombinase [Alcaligenes aquatilis]
MRILIGPARFGMQESWSLQLGGAKMLDQRSLVALLDNLGTPPAGRAMIQRAREEAPVRKVQSRGGNVLTFYQSRKMSRTIQTESRHLEFSAAIGHEFDHEVIEYYMQPSALNIEFIDDEGEVHQIDHTPDILVITERAIWFEEWKPWDRVEKRALRFPWRYRVLDDHWVSAPVEDYLAKRGIGYRILTEHDIPQVRVENALMLEDYFSPDSPDCPAKVEEAVKELLRAEPFQTLSDLYEKAQCGPDEVFSLIASGTLVSDFDTRSLREPRKFCVYRDSAVRLFEHAMVGRAKSNITGIVNIATNTKLSYDGRPHEVTFVGDQTVTLKNEADRLFELPLETLQELAARGSITMVDDPDAHDPFHGLADLSEKQLRIAVERQKCLVNGNISDRTKRRFTARLTAAKEMGVNELHALVPRFSDRGNRQPRLTLKADELIDESIQKHFLNKSAPSIKHAYLQLQHACNEAGIRSPSYETLRKRVAEVNRQHADLARHGKRMAYQRGDLVDVLYADTPVHGSRAFQYVHIDHTVLDMEVLSAETNKTLGRPTLSLAIDAYTRRILGLYLSFDPPSTKSTMMLIRDMVQRYKRLPQFLVVDNGPDFRSDDFRLLCELMRINIRYRPAARARHGAVMERIFGALHSEYIHNLAGNTKLTKYVRLVTKSFLPANLAEWTLELIYHGICFWAFEYYDSLDHTVLGMSPREAYEKSIVATGVREHRIVPYGRDFQILTCPSVDRLLRTIDMQRGVKVNSNYWYWCQEMRSQTVHGMQVHVRYDPFDISTVFARINGKWVTATCKALAPMRSMTTEEQKLYSTEMLERKITRKDVTPSPQLLAEFIQACRPKGIVQKQLERQKANRDLYNSLNQGAVIKLEKGIVTTSINSIRPSKDLESVDPISEADSSENDAFVFDENTIPSFEKV